MKATVECRDGFLFIAEEREGAMAWLPVRHTTETEARALGGRPVTAVDSTEGTYIDEEGNVYQLMDKGDTKPIEIGDLSGGEERTRGATRGFVERQDGRRTKRRAKAALEKESKQQPSAASVAGGDRKARGTPGRGTSCRRDERLDFQCRRSRIPRC